MAVFFTADTHFGHAGLLRRGRRTFPSVEAMDDAIVAGWNAVVGAADRIYHLGDFCFKGSARATAALERLNGEIVLLRGNHDTARTAALPRWSAVADLLEITLDGERLVLCHYPLLEWPGAFRGALHLHGHTHGALAPNRRRADVGVDVWAFRPVGLAQILERLESAPPYSPRDAYAAASTA